MIDRSEQNKLVQELRGMLGFPYKDGGYSPEDGGFMCWGFFVWSFKRASELFSMPELILPNDVYVAEKNFRMLHQDEIPKFLDVVVFRFDDLSERHVGLMIDNNRFAHCSRSSNGVAFGSTIRIPYRESGKRFARHKALS